MSDTQTVMSVEKTGRNGSRKKDEGEKPGRGRTDGIELKQTRG